MARLVREARADLRVRNHALQIVADVGGHKNRRGWIEAVQQWVQDNIQYVPDIRGIETLTPPIYMLAQLAGDCDDQATLTAALLESIGFKTQFVAVGPAPGVFMHVYCRVKLGDRWIAVETTEPWPLGREPRTLAPPMVEHV